LLEQGGKSRNHVSQDPFVSLVYRHPNLNRPVHFLLAALHAVRAFALSGDVVAAGESEEIIEDPLPYVLGALLLSL
jgi:hypothetical protein